MGDQQVGPEAWSPSVRSRVNMTVERAGLLVERLALGVRDGKILATLSAYIPYLVNSGYQNDGCGAISCHGIWNSILYARMLVHLEILETKARFSVLDIYIECMIVS